MNKARAYALGTQGIVVLASLSLWLVSGEVRQAFSGSQTGGVSPGMSREQADAQVDSAVSALGEGILTGDAELALSSCDDGDAEWLEEVRRTVEEVHTRLEGHGGEVLRSGGYWIIRPGKVDEVSSSVYGGAVAILDRDTGEVIHAVPYRALERGGRFRLFPYPGDSKNQIYFRRALARIYQGQPGMEEKALETWRQILADFPEGDREQRKQVYLDMARLFEEKGDFAGACEAYVGALELVEDMGESPFEIDGNTVFARQSEKLKYRLAQCALRAGQRDKVRALCEELTGSESEGLAGAARRMMAEL